MTSATAGSRQTYHEPGTILVLCADPDLGVRIAHWLGQAFLKAVRVDDGYSASDLLDQHGTCAIVTDRLLPPWPGLDAFALLRKNQPGLAVIYIGKGDVDDGSLARAAGATHVLPCPLRRQSVLDALQRGAAAA